MFLFCFVSISPTLILLVSLDCKLFAAGALSCFARVNHAKHISDNTHILLLIEAAVKAEKHPSIVK